jgi:hypothetical protein
MRDDMSKRLAIVFTSAALLAACAPNVYQDSRTPFPGYSNAVKQNAAVMIIDPQPVSAANVDIDLDGRRGGIAIERYRTGTVIPPEDLRTSEVLQ